MRLRLMTAAAVIPVAAGLMWGTLRADDANPAAKPGDAKPGEAKPGEAKPVSDAAEKAKIEKFLAHLKAEGDAGADETAGKWAKIRDKPLDTEDDFILEALADRHEGLSDALDLLDAGAYTNASRKLTDLLASVKDPYVDTHARYLLAKIRFHEGDWPGAAKDLGEILDKHSDRMTLEHEAFFFHARALANIAQKDKREEVGRRFTQFLEKYPYSRQRYLAAAKDLALEVPKTLPTIRSEGLTKVNGGPEELPNFAKDLRNIEKRIQVPLRDTGKDTQKLQSDALAYLDNLIDKLQQQQQQQQQQDQNDPQQNPLQQPQEQNDPQQQQQQQQQNQDDPQQKPGDPRKNSQLPQAGLRGAGALKTLEELRRGNISLPPDEVQKIIMEALKNGNVPEKYRRALELYSEELGGKVNKKK